MFSSCLVLTYIYFNRELGKGSNMTEHPKDGKKQSKARMRSTQSSFTQTNNFSMELGINAQNGDLL